MAGQNHSPARQLMYLPSDFWCIYVTCAMCSTVDTTLCFQHMLNRPLLYFNSLSWCLPGWCSQGFWRVWKLPNCMLRHVLLCRHETTFLLMDPLYPHITNTKWIFFISFTWVLVSMAFDSSQARGTVRPPPCTPMASMAVRLSPHTQIRGRGIIPFFWMIGMLVLIRMDTCGHPSWWPCVSCCSAPVRLAGNWYKSSQDVPKPDTSTPL